MTDHLVTTNVYVEARMEGYMMGRKEAHHSLYGSLLFVVDIKIMPNFPIRHTIPNTHGALERM